MQHGSTEGLMISSSVERLPFQSEMAKAKRKRQEAKKKREETP
jgi:hypothetical protein